MKIQELSFCDKRRIWKQCKYEILESFALTDMIGVRDLIKLTSSNQEHEVNQADEQPSLSINYSIHGSNSKRKQTCGLNMLTRRHGHEPLVQIACQLITSMRNMDSSPSLHDLNMKIIGDQICSTS
ncbi:uncharacterized protein MELLADRAFT_113674 [Melampsora larici-populina 98AG31]|uniref:Uncharacterized protein n=1 Tax=Melampsora larici-populina (strain 98AG31 / pathotype 3-4-7) TaxID=747676 RepID=F4SAQ1_MELLP|nr:uncharacterized protein MELLADRAFT_113674 [Melampsora larici-populina 98AG31]EGF98278.1 hypothetical protein MELLADRAFT_113674 [Melampsora larici-populina 98AG31]